jgi:hypothetical protein
MYTQSIRKKVESAALYSIICLLATLFLAPPTLADPTPLTNKGLTISPAVSFQKISAGQTRTTNMQISNGRDSPISVQLAVKQFTVNAYSYTYNFVTPKVNWIHLSDNTLALSPHSSDTISYTINVPKDSPPGGNYFTLIAQTDFLTGSVKSVGRIASLLYVTVSGKLTYDSHIVNGSINHFAFGPNIDYKFTILGTGNTYDYVYANGQLHGLSTGLPATPKAHIIYPGVPRTFSGSMSHPLLPGVYPTSYGYTTSDGGSVEKKSWVVYLPPWSIALVLVIALLALQVNSRKQRRRPTTYSKPRR